MIIYNRNGKYIKWMLVSFVLFIITAILNLIVGKGPLSTAFGL
jgi:hypothetical protein